MTTFKSGYDITKHPLYRQLSDYDKRNRFDAARFLSTDLKIKPGDTFEVHDIVLPEPPPPEAFVN